MGKGRYKNSMAPCEAGAISVEGNPPIFWKRENAEPATKGEEASFGVS